MLYSFFYANWIKGIKYKNPISWMESVKVVNENVLIREVKKA